MTPADLKRTPLHEAHVALGAKMVPFGGWVMPVSYSGIIDEHKTVRSAVGVFDVSHMGEIVFSGPGAAAAVQHLCTNDVGKLVDGAACYTVMCYEDGGIVDDCIVYRVRADRFFIADPDGNRIEIIQWKRPYLETMNDE